MENPLSKLSLKKYEIRIIVVDITTNKIVKWIE